MKIQHPFDLENHISTNQLLTVLPGNIYWKDLQGNYLGSNDTLINTLGLRSVAQIIGRNDEYLLGLPYAEKIIENDQRVIATKIEQTFYEHAFSKNCYRATYLSKKVPLYDTQNTLIGIMGLSFDITDRFRRAHQEKIIDVMDNKIILQSSMPKLSSRQQQCLDYLLKGLSAKDIALRLKLSVRTVETHIEALKQKFQCNKKSDLINKVLPMIANPPIIS